MFVLYDQWFFRSYFDHLLTLREVVVAGLVGVSFVFWFLGATGRFVLYRFVPPRGRLEPLWLEDL